ncbi:hypothetical protein DFJ74DRAFT_330003 [Hyaloraphidium curvatum]|nr:hypothetical protein DFJ74DRAFT_330003 [Hyaloraphidium curvatum]
MLPMRRLEGSRLSVGQAAMRALRRDRQALREMVDASRGRTQTYDMSRDDSLLELLDLIDNYQDLQKQCFADLAKAYFDLAKAKYIMGPSKLSHFNFDQRMKAIAKVSPEASKSAADNETGLEEAFSKLTLERISTIKSSRRSEPAPGGPGATEEDVAVVGTALEGEGTTNLRRRRKGPPQDEEQPSEKDSSSSGAREGASGGSEDKDVNGAADAASDRKPATRENVVSETVTVDEGLRDPIKWFGILVPPALRSAQSNFQKALEKLVVLANMAQELRGLADSCQEGDDNGRQQELERLEAKGTLANGHEK